MIRNNAITLDPENGPQLKELCALTSAHTITVVIRAKTSGVIFVGFDGPVNASLCGAVSDDDIISLFRRKQAQVSIPLGADCAGVMAALDHAVLPDDDAREAVAQKALLAQLAQKPEAQSRAGASGPAAMTRRTMQMMGTAEPTPRSIPTTRPAPRPPAKQAAGRPAQSLTQRERGEAVVKRPAPRPAPLSAADDAFGDEA